MPAVNTQTSANVESCARNSRTPGLSITVHTGSPRSPTHRADRSIRSASASAPIALAQSPPSNLPPRVVVEATNGTGSPGAIASSPSTPPRVPWRGSLCRVKRVVFAAASGVDSSGGTPRSADGCTARRASRPGRGPTHRCLPDASRRNRSPTSRGVDGSGVPSFDLRPSTSTHASGAAPSSGRPQRRPSAGCWRRRRRCPRAREGAGWARRAPRAAATAGRSRLRRSGRRPPRGIPRRRRRRQRLGSSRKSSSSPVGSSVDPGALVQPEPRGRVVHVARVDDRRVGLVRVAVVAGRRDDGRSYGRGPRRDHGCRRARGATAAGDTGARHDACASMAAGMHRAPAE